MKYFILLIICTKLNAQSIGTYYHSKVEAKTPPAKIATTENPDTIKKPVKSKAVDYEIILCGVLFKLKNNKQYFIPNVTAIGYDYKKLTYLLDYKNCLCWKYSYTFHSEVIDVSFCCTEYSILKDNWEKITINNRVAYLLD